MLTLGALSATEDTKASMQMNTLSPKQNALSYSAALAFILAMVAVAAGLQDREIVLPEMAAMAVALWAYRDQQ